MMANLSKIDDGSVVVVSWTGGKDGCLALYKAILAGYNVSHLLNFRSTSRIGSHDLCPDLLKAQSEAIGIPLIQTDFVSYEDEFKNVVRSLLKSGVKIDGAVFGHIETHKNLVDRVCGDLEIELIMPLWQQDSEQIIKDIIDAGFGVIVTSFNSELFGEEWLKRKIDAEFIEDLTNLNESIDPCGENGEFHTFVYDGPIFQKIIEITGYQKVHRNGYWFMEVSEFYLKEKSDN